MSARDDYPWHDAMERLNHLRGAESALDEIDRLRLVVEALSAKPTGDDIAVVTVFRPGGTVAAGQPVRVDAGTIIRPQPRLSRKRNR